MISEIYSDRTILAERLSLSRVDHDKSLLKRQDREGAESPVSLIIESLKVTRQTLRALIRFITQENGRRDPEYEQLENRYQARCDGSRNVNVSREATLPYLPS